MNLNIRDDVSLEKVLYRSYNDFLSEDEYNFEETKSESDEENFNTEEEISNRDLEADEKKIMYKNDSYLGTAVFFRRILYI